MERMMEHIMFAIVVLIGAIMVFGGVWVIPPNSPFSFFDIDLLLCGCGIFIVYIGWKSIYD